MLNQRQALRRVLDLQRAVVAVCHAESFGIYFVIENDAVITQFDDVIHRSDAEFVQPVLRMHRQHPLGAERARHFDHRPQPRFAEHAQHLMLDAGGVGQRAQDVKHGADADGATDGHDMAHRLVIRLGEHEAETRFRNACLHLRGFEIHDHACLTQDIGTAGSAAGGDVTMLGDLHPAGGGNHCRCRRDVKKTGAIAASANGIHQHALAQIGGFCQFAHHLRRRRHLACRLALHRQRRQERANRCRIGLTVHQRQHDVTH